jgi:hypothetical protein
VPEVGTLSANGSRRWDGQFWVPVYTDPPLEQLAAPVAYRPVAREFDYERRGYGLGAVVLAPIVGVIMGSIRFPPPATGSLESSLIGFLVINLVWAVLAYGAVVVILSLGRQGVDVLFLRAILVAFIEGTAFVAIPLIANQWDATQTIQPPAVGPFRVVALIPWPLVALGVGLVTAVIQGPFLFAFATLSNLLWYRSFRSLRPQLPIFNRVSQVPQYPPSRG